MVNISKSVEVNMQMIVEYNKCMTTEYMSKLPCEMHALFGVKHSTT